MSFCSGQKITRHEVPLALTPTEYKIYQWGSSYIGMNHKVMVLLLSTIKFNWYVLPKIWYQQLLLPQQLPLLKLILIATLKPGLGGSEEPRNRSLDKSNTLSKWEDYLQILNAWIISCVLSTERLHNMLILSECKNTNCWTQTAESSNYAVMLNYVLPGIMLLGHV